VTRTDLLRYPLYLLRWQLSSPLLAVVTLWLGSGWGPAVVANLIGGLLFFWVDRFLFKSRHLERIVEEWEVLPDGECYDCGQTGRVRRLVFTLDYDRRLDERPQYRCPACSERKLQQVRDLLHRKGTALPS